MKVKGKFLVFGEKAVRYQNIVYLERRTSYNDTKIYFQIGNDHDTFSVNESVDEIIKCMNRSTRKDKQ